MLCDCDGHSPGPSQSPSPDTHSSSRSQSLSLAPPTASTIQGGSSETSTPRPVFGPWLTGAGNPFRLSPPRPSQQLRASINFQQPCRANPTFRSHYRHHSHFEDFRTEDDDRPDDQLCEGAGGRDQQEREPSHLGEQSCYSAFTSDDPDFQPCGQIGDNEGPTIYPVEAPLYLDKHRFRPEGPCRPTRKVQRAIEAYYTWFLMCLRGSQPSATAQERATYLLAEMLRPIRILGNNDDPDSNWEPPESSNTLSPNDSDKLPQERRSPTPPATASPSPILCPPAQPCRSSNPCIPGGPP